MRAVLDDASQARRRLRAVLSWPVQPELDASGAARLALCGEAPLLVTALLLPMMYTGMRVTRAEGGALVTVALAYTAWLFAGGH